MAVTGVGRAVVVQHLKLHRLARLKAARENMCRFARSIVGHIGCDCGQHLSLFQHLQTTSTKPPCGPTSGFITEDDARTLGLGWHGIGGRGSQKRSLPPRSVDSRVSWGGGVTPQT